MKRLFFVRHGLTEANVAGIISGHHETPLTETGEEQAKQTGLAIKDTNTRVDYIIASPYERARETARIIAEQIGYPADKIELNDLFVERCFGVLEGTDGSKYLKKHQYKDYDKVEGAETIEQMQVRAQKALDYVRGLDHDNILVVSHGAFGRAFRRATNNLPHTHEYEVFDPISNAEFLELI